MNSCFKAILPMMTRTFTTKFKKFSSWKYRIWPIGYIPIDISILNAFNQYQYNKTNQWIRYEKRPNPVCRCIQAGKCYCLMFLLWRWACHDWVNQPGELLSATVSLHFYLIFNIRLNKILAYLQSSWKPQCLTPNKWQSQWSWMVGAVN